ELLPRRNGLSFAALPLATTLSTTIAAMAATQRRRKLSSSTLRASSSPSSSKGGAPRRRGLGVRSAVAGAFGALRGLAGGAASASAAVGLGARRAGASPGGSANGNGPPLQPKAPTGANLGLAHADDDATGVMATLAPPKKVLVLMSDTGGGHRASAQALKAAFDELYPGQVAVEVVDIWTDFGRWPYNQFVPAYQYLAKHPIFWRAFWEYGRFPLTRLATETSSNLVCHEAFRRCIEEADPDLVVSVHPLCQDIPLRVLKQIGGGRRRVPFVTVVTDLGAAHPTWFHREADACFVPSEELATLARRAGLEESRIRLHGLPTRPGFWREQPLAKDALQKKLGLAPGVKTCLVVGGGDGVGGLAGVAAEVGETLGAGEEERQVVVVCGKNEAVRRELAERPWAPHLRMHVKGFVSNMDEYMAAADCIVTKAGPGTIAEAAIRGLPVMLSGFLPGQEAGNVPYVTGGGFGAFSRDPHVIGATVRSWLGDDSKLAAMSAAARRAARPAATHGIAADIGGMLFGGARPLEPPP
ncbi:unnamed protein product, partial [Phaeothamnion confervicola]